ncbi:class I SAM-dependent methyltransferase [Streptomyces sp. NPDC047971]|uniref:class I SAM-dependent methyltransferase n=1 Tax=Streptomyces sp. NPDC047971 TaxID=3154499 RepID=UPI0033CE31F2
MSAIVNQQQAEAWNGWEGQHWADHPERYDAMLEGFNAPLFEAADIGERHEVLDVGCGAGLTTRMAARRARRGHALGIDLSGPMLERARSTAAAEGIDNVAFVQGDAQVHPLPVAGFDTVMSRGGVMFFADPVAAFAHLRASLVPGGRLAFLGPHPGGPDGAYARATSALTPHLREASPAARGMGSLIDPSRITEVLDRAGYDRVETTAVHGDMGFGADPEDAAGFILSMGPTRYNLRNTDPGTKASLRERLVDALAEFATPAGVRIPGSVWIVTAESPGGSVEQR